MEIDYYSPSRFQIPLFAFDGKGYNYDGPFITSKNNRITCPVCNARHSLLSATKKGIFLEFSNGASDKLVEPGSELEVRLIDFVNEAIAKLELEKMDEEQGCEKCITKDI